MIKYCATTKNENERNRKMKKINIPRKNWKRLLCMACYALYVCMWASVSRQREIVLKGLMHSRVMDINRCLLFWTFIFDVCIRCRHIKPFFDRTSLFFFFFFHSSVGQGGLIYSSWARSLFSIILNHTHLAHDHKSTNYTSHHLAYGQI